MDGLKNQYDWIRRTREVLFTYCESLAPSDYVKELESFGGDSIRNLHAHVADCYRTWLGIMTLGKPIPHVQLESVQTVQDMRKIFKETDEVVYDFLDEFKGKWDQAIHVDFSDDNSAKTTPLWLVTHTMTHEFHHKGQIVKIGRQLGYVPPDTDLLDPRSEGENL
ncbi:DinB family protein [Metabacillus sp. 113a]|uniref:DinB family protein n=1 Tax=Metabacillus sp. 113a TaxID=3404706 RepID=UPI003CF5247B